MIALMPVSESCPVDIPLMTCGVRDNGDLLVWNQCDAVAAHRQVVAMAGPPPAEFASYSLRIVGAIPLSAAGVSSEVLQKEHGWTLTPPGRIISGSIRAGCLMTSQYVVRAQAGM